MYKTRYYVNFYYVGINDGKMYGDMGYNFCDLGDNWCYDLNECIEGVRESLNNPMESEYESGEARSRIHPDPRVIQIVECGRGCKDISEGEIVYTFANCGRKLGKELGIEADEYIETYDGYYTENVKIGKNLKHIDESQIRAIVASVVNEVMGCEGTTDLAERLKNSLTGNEYKELRKNPDFFMFTKCVNGMDIEYKRNVRRNGGCFRMDEVMRKLLKDVSGAYRAIKDLLDPKDCRIFHDLYMSIADERPACRVVK